MVWTIFLSSPCPRSNRKLPLPDHDRLFHRRGKHDFAVHYMPILAALQINRAGQFLMAIKRSAGDARDLVIVDDGLPVLYDRNGSSYQGDIKSLPFAWLARLLGRCSNETVNTAGVMARRL